MKEISENLFMFFSSNTDFSALFQTRFFPIVANAQTPFPFATYKIETITVFTKDKHAADATLIFWFNPNQYAECCALVDKMQAHIESSENYMWVDTSIDFIDENLSYAGIINIKII